VKVLVTGVSGFLARHVVPAVIATGAELRASSRGPRPDWLDDSADYLAADLTAPVPGELLEGVSHVIHLAGASSSRSSEQQMHQVNVTGTANLAAAILRHAPLARLVHVSSTSVYGEETPLALPVREDSPLLPSRAYGKTKLDAEKVVFDAIGEGLRALIVRPVTVFGPYNTKLVASTILDASLERAAGLSQLDLEAPPVGLRLVHAHDAAGALLHLGVRCGSEVLGRAFNLSLPEFPTSHEVGSAVAAALGMTPRIVSEGPAGLPLAQREATWEQAQRSAGLIPKIILSPKRLQFLTRPNPNNALSLEALLGTGFHFQHTDLPAEIAHVVAWYTEHRWIV
jgi:nucleoside-diphosphate-sugar epimerase